MDGGAWWSIVHGVEKSQTRLSDFSLHHVTQFEYVTNFCQNYDQYTLKNSFKIK